MKVSYTHLLGADRACAARWGRAIAQLSGLGSVVRPVAVSLVQRHIASRQPRGNGRVHGGGAVVPCTRSRAITRGKAVTRSKAVEVPT